MTATTTINSVPPTTEELERWQNWCIEELHPNLTPFRDVQQPGTFLVATSKYKPSFKDIGTCWLNTFAIEKVTKLKVGNDYRSSLEGWIIPEALVEPFHQCRRVALLYRDLRRNAIDTASRLQRNGYEMVCVLSPERMQAFIELFSDS